VKHKLQKNEKDEEQAQAAKEQALQKSAWGCEK